MLWTTSSSETSAAVFGDFGFRHEHAVIPVGARSADLTIPIVADALDEPTERFRIELLDAQRGRLGDRYGNVWIGDDDG